jgi:hypothetical protein
MMARSKMARGLLGGLIVGILFGAGLLFVWPAWAADPLKRLPDSPEIPDLYDPTIVSTYVVVAQRPYQVGGQPLAPWLIATVLTPQTVHVGPFTFADAPAGFGGSPRDVILVFGYVTDTRDGRIISLTETIGHPHNNTRSVKAWVDEGWVKTGKGSGEWRPALRSDTPLTPQQTAVFMEQVYRLIQTGFQQTLTQ